MSKSIRTRLTTAFILLAIGPILVVTILLSYKSIAALREAAIARQSVEAARVSIAVEEYVHELERVLELSSQAGGFISLSRIEQRDIFEDILAYENRFNELTLVGKDGKELIRSDRTHIVFDNALVDRRDDPAIQHVMTLNTNYFSQVSFDTITGEPHMTIAIPLQSFMTGQIEYVLIGSIRLKKIWDLLANISHKDELVFIIDEAGNIVGHPDPSVALSGQKYVLPSTLSGIGVGLSGNKVVMAAQQLRFAKRFLYIVAQQDVITALALSKSIAFIGLLVFVISLALAICLSFLIIGNIVRPLQHLASVARNIQKGDLSQQAVYKSNDEVGELSTAFNDMTMRLRGNIENLEKENEERKHTEEILRESRSMLKQVLNTAPQSIFWKDINGAYLGCNQVFAQSAGLETPAMIIGKSDFDLPWPKAEAEAYRADDREVTQANRPKMHIIEVLQKADGNRIWIDTSKVPLLDGHGKVYGVLGVFEDITERKQAEVEKQNLEARLNQAQKMEAIGTLAGGIAHDFNNILGIILGYADMAKDDAPPGTKYQKDLDRVLAAANRAKDLVQQILAFSRQSDIDRMPIKIQSLIKEGLKMLRSSIPTTISITENIDPKSGVILADPTQVHQILMNLCTNSYHAMEATGGELSVSLKTTFVGEDDKECLHVTTGEYVEFTVSDTGSGIGPDVIDKIFDPYFTTKEIGKGTGMGLAIIHGIMKDYGGTVTVESQLGKGTTFHVYFPVIQKDAIPEIIKSEDVPKGTARILFIDDEEFLAQMGKDMLERLGHHVTVRRSSLEALATFQNTPNEFDLVITDQTMPNMTGSDLARRMMQIRPDIPIILCTGYSNLIDEDSAKSLGIKEFALKPLTKGVIAQLIKKVLNGMVDA